MDDIMIFDFDSWMIFIIDDGVDFSGSKEIEKKGILGG